MVTISGYQVGEKLYESSRSLIYKAQRDSDQAQVLLKMLRHEYPLPAAIARLQMEYDILNSLNLEGVVKAYGLETYHQSPVIVLEDFGGESLQSWLHQRSFELEEFLTLAIQITSILGQIHQHGIIHKDINPSNIVLNPAIGQVKIIDFGIASVLSQENPTLRNPDLLEGTLAYMSPEQTGRMNRSIDYRTDFYSLGATFYQLLCDRLPFATTDALELVHCHLAKTPAPLHMVVGVESRSLGAEIDAAAPYTPHALASPKAIPTVVSDIVMKLLAKNAEDRYQSTHGIWADLQECLNQLQQGQQIQSFAVGRWDISGTFQIPQKLYGREQEVADLLTAFERMVGSQEQEIKAKEDFNPTPNALSSTSLPGGLILVSGYPGVGKTTLVQELYKPVTQQRGYFITGKYDQLQRGVPYSGLIQAFQALIRQLLTEPEERLADWRERLLTALGDNGQLVIDVIPEVERIIAQQPNVVELPLAESQNRFHLVLERFVRVFTQPIGSEGVENTHPLIIFLDDLQWADSSSLQLIQQWLTALKDQRLLIIGAYRDNEVDTTQLLARSLNEIRQAGGTVHQIALAPLELADVNCLLQDTLHCQAEKSLPLAKLTRQKTDGNPFFINEFLRFLHQEKLIDFDVQQGIWHWDLAQIQTAPLPDNIVTLVANRIQELPAQSQQTLSLAAYIGNQFDLQTLALICERSPLETANDLRQAAQQSLITPIGDDYKYLESYPSSAQIELDVIYRFLHDRIQQSAYFLIPDSDKSRYHLKIGQLLLQATPRECLEEKIFDIVDHFNTGIGLITDQAQRHKLAQLNLIAGQKAQTSIAYESALSYLNQGRSLLAENSWETAYELTLQLNELTAKAAYLAGDFEQMEQRIEEVLQHARTALESTRVNLVRIQAYIAQDRLMAAIEIALQSLDSLGLKLPAQPDATSISQGRCETELLLRERQIADLAQLPRMTDPHKLAAMEMIASVCTPTYFLAPELWELMVFQKVQLSVNHGNAPGSAFGYADYGMIQCGVAGNIDAASQFAQLAVTLQAQLNAKEFVPKTSLLVYMYLKHWREHLRETLKPLLEAYQSGLETGDLEYATFAIACRFYHSYIVGQELTQLEQEMASYESAIAQFKQVLPLNLTRIYRQAVLNLIEPGENSCCLIGQSYNEDESLPLLMAANDQYILFHLYLNKLILCYLFQEIELAAKYAAIADQLLCAGAIGLLVVPIFYFYDSLIKIAIFPAASAREQQQMLLKIDANQQKMNHWASHASMNYLHKFHLVEAERHRILGQYLEAMDAYDRAIELAQEHEYCHEEALANELAGKFYLAKGKTKIAQTYLCDARYGYLRWGAMAKVRQLDQCYPQFFERLSETTSMVAHSQHASPITISSTVTAALDLATVLKASQALSDEIVLDRLLAKLMIILIENAGAQRGCLLLENNGKLQVEAEADGDNVSVLQALAIDTEAAQSLVPVAIVNYVARSQESVVLNHATQDYRFKQDAYIISHQPKSVLCTPLIYQGKLSGILYLENNLTTEAFTPNRLEILQFLSTQAAISLDNAQLYNQLELRVQERTAELTQTNGYLQTEILERQRSEQILRMIVEGTAAVTGAAFFRSLVRALAQALNVRYAFISECMDALPTRVRSFAFWQGHEFGDEFEYDLPGTPCERILTSKNCQCFSDQLQTLFPDDQDLEAMQAQSYAGIALLDSTGNLMGHLAILDDRPLENESRTRAVLEIFAARAAAEMERKQAEDALRVSETKFSTAFRSSPDAITISTLKDGSYIEVNDSCLRMLGYCREEMIGRNALDLGVWAKSDDRDAIKQRLQQQGTVTNLEIKLRRKSGEIFPVLFSAEIIHLEDEPCLLAVAADITMLKQAEKALERLAEVGELAAMIVHEVRNPLTTISMGLKSFKKLQLSERFQEYLALSLDEADRLQRLLNQILLYSRPQTLQRSPLELNNFIANTLNALQTLPIAAGKYLQLIIDSGSVQVLADSDKLKQVLINLVTNACEAVSEGDVITIQIQKTVNHQVCIQIHNGGAPIPADVLPQLTKPFFTTKASGTGLGLAIVKRIVEAHDGEFRIESSMDTGTLVKVQLALAGEPIPQD